MYTFTYQKIITLFCYSNNMALREVKPLDEKQWKLVTKQLASGPSNKSIKAVNYALKLANEIKEA